MVPDTLVHIRTLHFAITILHPPIQFHLLQHRAEALTSLRTSILLAVPPYNFTLQPLYITTFASTIRILNVKHGFAGCYEGCEGFALAVPNTLFVYAEVHNRKHGGYDVSGVFEAEREVQGCS
jgi:hypothetical protein